MSSNRLHKIFNSTQRLRREDIQAYGITGDKELKNHIEQKSLSSSFDQDALEGWSELSYDTSVLNRLDTKFVGANSTIWYWIAGTTVACLSVALIVVYNLKMHETPSDSIAGIENNEVDHLLLNQEITVEESDIIIPQPIEEMVMVPQIEQVQIKKIKKDFAEMKLIVDSQVEIRDIKPIDNIDNNEKIVVNRTTAKEIYLNDLKLVDYRLYRSNPQITSKQVILSGTPANLEEKGNEEVTSTWKTVDIPYMEFLEKSVRIFGKGNYKKALSRFGTILETYPEDVNANFYSGLCLFNFGEYTTAQKSFQICVDGPFSNFDEESTWMIALCLEKSGEIQKARKFFLEIKSAKGFYAKQAQQKLK